MYGAKFLSVFFQRLIKRRTCAPLAHHTHPPHHINTQNEFSNYRWHMKRTQYTHKIPTKPHFQNRKQKRMKIQTRNSMYECVYCIHPNVYRSHDNIQFQSLCLRARICVAWYMSVFSCSTNFIWVLYFKTYCFVYLPHLIDPVNFSVEFVNKHWIRAMRGNRRAQVFLWAFCVYIYSLALYWIEYHFY